MLHFSKYGLLAITKFNGCSGLILFVVKHNLGPPKFTSEIERFEKYNLPFSALKFKGESFKCVILKNVSLSLLKLLPSISPKRR